MGSLLVFYFNFLSFSASRSLLIGGVLCLFKVDNSFIGSPIFLGGFIPVFTLETALMKDYNELAFFVGFLTNF
jgi:hypothetical protein